jgi:hypothetical protein
MNFILYILYWLVTNTGNSQSGIKSGLFSSCHKDKYCIVQYHFRLQTIQSHPNPYSVSRLSQVQSNLINPQPLSGLGIFVVHPIGKHYK